MFKFDIDEALAAVLFILALGLIALAAVAGGSLLGDLGKESAYSTTSLESKVQSLTLQACAKAQTPIEFGEGFFLSGPSRTEFYVYGVRQVVEMEYEDGKLKSCKLRD